MLYDLGVCLAALILLSPIFVFGLAWAKIRSFYQSTQVQRGQRLFYLVALVAGSVSLLAYLGYWAWRICEIYRIPLPIDAVSALDRLIALSSALPIVAVPCLLLGRGPNRILLMVAILWLMFELWTHGRIIHWA